ncbi:hypothetical protein E2I00_014047 [Balaenoptera physalus]|uniref:Leucine-rich repeat-containing protein 37 N-terminal domain-containing protein n=1 Tax=Balaenoptera physalus TaxID=9770 RepID=A0A643BP46_BALPH|nr:hypothetical protein E2I00_014047 [Balaenoptera physalus]
MVELVPFEVPIGGDKTLLVWELSSGCMAEALQVSRESGKVAVAYRPCEEVTDARTEEELQDLIQELTETEVPHGFGFGWRAAYRARSVCCSTSGSEITSKPNIRSSQRQFHKTKIIGLDQAEGHSSFEILVPPLGSKSSKPMKFIAESLPRQEAPAQHPQIPEEVESFLPQAEAQAQHPEPTEEENPSQPPESPEEVEPSPVQQQAPSQPPEHPEEVEPSLLHQEAPSQAPGFPTEYVLQIPVSDEVASLPGVQHHAHSNLPSVTLQPLDLELTITPEPTTEAEFPTAQQEALAPPLEHPEETESSPTQQETSAKPPEPPGEVEPSRSNMETVPSPIMQETPTQPSEAPQEVAVQSPFQQEVTVPTPCQDYVQYSTSSSVTVHHVDLEQTTTAEPTMEAGHSTALQQTTAPPPKHPEVTLAQPNLTQVTVPPVDLGVNIFHQPRPSETVLFPLTQYSPNTYSGTFTIINFQGNSISYIDESIWQAYCWAEKLG